MFGFSLSLYLPQHSVYIQATLHSRRHSAGLSLKGLETLFTLFLKYQCWCISEEVRLKTVGLVNIFSHLFFFFFFSCDAKTVAVLLSFQLPLFLSFPLSLHFFACLSMLAIESFSV